MSTNTPLHHWTELANEIDDRRVARTRRRRTVAATVVMASIAVTSGVAARADARVGNPSVDSTTAGTVIVDWNGVAMDALTPSGRPLITQPFVVATMHVAMYDAVVAVEGRYEPFHGPVPATSTASPVAAAAQAAHDVLVAYLPASAPTFDQALAATLSGIDGDAASQGVDVGRLAAANAVAARADDGSQSGPVPPIPPPAPGQWQPTPPATSGLTPWIAVARPFVMASPSQFRPAPPPALTTSRYRRAVDELRRLGGATSVERTEEQSAAARFWADQPIAQNQRTLRNHATKLGWDLVDTARLFAATLTSEADALIACWDAKYHYQLWRPWQSVPLVEPGWTPLVGTPNHPEFPSAHGCLTGALGDTLARLMGTEVIDLDVDALNVGTTRHFRTRHDLLREVGNARIWGGLHYRFSVDTGLDLAHRVVKLNLRTNFRGA